MMQFDKEIEDSEIRVIGSDQVPVTVAKCSHPSRRGCLWVAGIAFAVALVAGMVAVAYVVSSNKTKRLYEEEPSYFEPLMESEPLIKVQRIEQSEGAIVGYTEIRDTTVNDIPIRMYIPRHAEMSLHLGRINRQDTTIVYVAQAADVRADNGGIVGAFVLRGEPKAWGLSKKGYCASIDGKVTVGVAPNSPLFEQATERGGYFFRQYPLVDNGVPVLNEPKGKAIRRGICDMGGTIFMVETLTKESFYDYAQALADMGVDHAVYLVGSTAYGWAVDRQGIAHEFGEDDCYAGRRRMPKNTSYIVWRRK